MKISEGFVFILLAIAIWLVANYYGWNDLMSFFFVGVGLARLNDYWNVGGKNNEKS